MRTNASNSQKRAISSTNDDNAFNDRFSPYLSESAEISGRFFLTVEARPNARQDRIYNDGERIYVDITAVATKGKANSAITRFLGDFFHISKSHIILLKGPTAHTKLFQLDIPDRSIADLLHLIENG